MDRYGFDIKSIRTHIRFLYPKCELQIHRNEIVIESIRHRYDIDIRTIDDVYAST